jgi:transcriptional regulator with XRE-family HTH domain
MAAKKLTMIKPKHLEARRGDVERHVAWRIRERRIVLGMTQRHLAERIGLGYQQIHSYETGKNRISAGILDRIAEALGVDVGHFYEGSGATIQLKGRPRAIVSLVRDFTNVTDPRQQQALLRLSRALADADLGKDDDVEAENG